MSSVRVHDWLAELAIKASSDGAKLHISSG